MRGPTNPPDATMRLLDHLAEGGEGEVGQLATLALEAGPQPFYRVGGGGGGGVAGPPPFPLGLDHPPSPGLRAGGWAGRRSTPSQCRWLATNACICLLR